MYEKAKQEIREWYMSNYPTDELGKDIQHEVTFYDLFECMDNYKDVYELLGVDDSIVRERVFSKLAEIMEVSYDYIYDQWMIAAI